MRQRVQDLIGAGDRLFSQRSGLLATWQELAEHFYPERADFTSQRNIGADIASHLMDSYPMLCRRELANSFSAMLRPVGRPWFKLRTVDEDRSKDAEAKRWLDYASTLMRKAMYERQAQFVRATKEGDHDFAAFGQAVIQPTYRANMSGLLYRTWHLRDVVWCEDHELAIDTVHRKWKTTARDAYSRWPDKTPPQLVDRMKKEPYCPVELRHIVLPADQYDSMDSDRSRWQRRKQPFVSIYVDKEHQVILEELGVPDIGYVIPRWQTVSGSQYAHSPATVAGLANSRLLQRMSLTLLEAGEKAVDPPLVAVGEHIQGGVNMFAGGVTYIDAEYDERTGEALRTLQRDVGRGLAFGQDEIASVREIINHAFYLNKINLPDTTHDMTAFEVAKRMDEYVRNALPLFEPAEVEYNGGLCDYTMQLLLRANAFGPPESLPESLQGQDVRFVYESPLQAATDRAKSEALNEAGLLLKGIAELEQLNPLPVLDMGTAVRDALDGLGVPPQWMLSEEQAAQIQQQRDEAQAKAQQLAQAQQLAEAANTAGQAAQGLQGAGVLPTNPMQVMTGQEDPRMANVLEPPPEAVKRAA
jgi:hypothetical protein